VTITETLGAPPYREAEGGVLGFRRCRIRTRFWPWDLTLQGFGMGAAPNIERQQV